MNAEQLRELELRVMPHDALGLEDTALVRAALRELAAIKEAAAGVVTDDVVLLAMTAMFGEQFADVSGEKEDAWTEIVRRGIEAAAPPLVAGATTAANAATTAANNAQQNEVTKLQTELGRAYRAVLAYTNAHRNGKSLPDHAVAYHSLTEAAAKRFLYHDALDGSEYFIGKHVDVLHAALRGEEPSPPQEKKS